jgi:hypothetical protein
VSNNLTPLFDADTIPFEKGRYHFGRAGNLRLISIGDIAVSNFQRIPFDRMEAGHQV